MKILILFLLFVFTIFSLLMAYVFADIYTVKIEDFVIKKVTLKGNLIITKDEYGIGNSSLAFFIEEDNKKYTLAGKLLDLSKQEIYELKSGEQVELWVKKKQARSFFDRFMKHYASIWGINDASGSTLLALETAMKQQKGFSSLVYVTFFLLATCLSAFYFYQKIKH